MKFRVPHAYVLLMSLIIIAALSTWIIPAGKYDRVQRDGRELIDPLTYHRVEPKPADSFLCFSYGLELATVPFLVVYALHWGPF